MSDVKYIVSEKEIRDKIYDISKQLELDVDYLTDTYNDILKRDKDLTHGSFMYQQAYAKLLLKLPDLRKADQKDKSGIITLKGMGLVELLNSDTASIEYLVEGIIPKKGLVYVYGPPASFKTNFLMYLTLNCAKGDKVFDFEVEKDIKILWVDEENRRIGMYAKLKQITNGMRFFDNNSGFSDDKYRIIYENDFNILNPGHISALDKYIKDSDCNLVVIDSIAKVFPLNERDETDVKRIYTMLKSMMSNYDVSFVLIHHTRKLYQGQKDRGMEDMSGSREFSAMADSMLYLQPVNKEKNKFMLKQTKNRYDRVVDAINFMVDGDDESMNITYAGLLTENVEEYKRNKKSKKVSVDVTVELIKWISDNPQETYASGEMDKAMGKLNFKRGIVQKAIKTLVENEFLEKESKGQYIVIRHSKNREV